MSSKIANAVATEAGISQKAAAELVDVVASAVRVLAEAGETVRVPGLGTFKLKQVAARKGRNPATGEPIYIEAHTRLAFKETKAK